MPRYHSLDTEVQLFTWDPLSCRSIFHDFSRPTAQTGPTDWHSTTSSRSRVQKDTSTSHGWTPSSGHDQSRKVNKLAENYFKGQEGLDFLGNDAPFFLIHAGNDSFNVKRSLEPWKSMHSSPYQGHEVSSESSKGPIVTPFSRNQITEKAVPGTAYIGSAFNEGNQDRNDLVEVHSSSSLSSLSSTELLSPHASDFRSREPETEIGGRTFGPPFVTPKLAKRIADNLETSSSAAKLGIVTQPIQVVVKLSEKTFTNPLLGAESNHCDICINIFYNGEFNASQVIKYSAWAALKNKNSFAFGGRRIGTGHELPWMMAVRSKDADSTILQVESSNKALAPLERWNTLTEMLVLEANEWGRDERGYRCPTGEYLELLSMKAIPSELDGPQDNIGSGFGVIDVVITLGHMSHQDAAKEICSPRRYVHTSQQVAAQIEGKISTPLPARAIDSSRALSSPLSFNRQSSTTTMVEPPNASGTSSAKGMSHATAAAPSQRDQINAGAVEVATPAVSITNLMNHKADSQAVVKRSIQMSTHIPAPVAIAPTPRPPHPNKPKNVPQKTYRGSEPILQPSRPSKRRKTAKLFEELPFDLNTAAYMSTRARRSASMPFTQTSTNLQEEGSFKRKRNVNQATSTLSNTESSEASTAGRLFMLENDKGSNPQTPESSGPLKKKPRSSNFNAKLSNRPQNLRRKNSAGEWIVPPCRKNSAGEWETPTKGGKFETSRDLGGQADGAVTEDSGNMFQPVFADSADNTSRNMAIEPDTTDQISPNGDRIALKENRYESSPAEKANKLAFTVELIENKKENLPPNSSVRQRDEVLSPVTPTKLMISPSKVTYRGVKSPRTPVKSSPKQELLATSSPPPGKLAFEKYFRRMEEDCTITGIANTAGITHMYRRNTLRMRFFEGNINSDGEIVGDGCGTRRWLVRRCIAPEYVLSPGSGKHPASFPLFEKPKLKLSVFATSTKGYKVSDVLTDSATARSHRKSGTCGTTGLAATSKPVTGTLRDSRLGAPQQPQLLALTQPRPRFVIQNHNSRVLKLVNRRPVATETDGIKQEAHGTNAQASGSNHATREFGGDATNDSDGIDVSKLPMLEKQNGSTHSSQHDTNVKALSTPQSGSIESTFSSVESTMFSAQKKDSTQNCDSDAQLVQEDEASIQMPAGRKIPKRPFRPRTVGSTELKALLENHDRHKVTNNSFGTSLGMMHSQPMTRASRNAILSKPHRVIGASGIVTKKPVSSDKPIVQHPVTSNSVPRKRSSSGQFVENTKNTTLLPNRAENTDGGISKVVDAQTDSLFYFGASSTEVKKPSPETLKIGTPNSIAMVTMDYDISLLVAGKMPPIGNLETQNFKESVSRSQKVVESRSETVKDLGGKPFKHADMVETAVGYLNGAPIDKPILRHGKTKDTLKTDASILTNFKEAVEEVDVALRQVCRANTEVNKAAGDLESLTARASAQRIVQKAALADTDRVKLSNERNTEDLKTNVRGNPERTALSPPPLAPGVNTWKPSCLWDDSILTYAKDENWDDLERNSVTGQMCRRMVTQDEGYFKTFGILMGVRYVVVGSTVVNDCKIWQNA